MPWNPRFELTFDDDVPDAFRHRALRRDWQDDGIRLEQLAVEFAPDNTSETGLGGSCDVPSFDFAAQFGLRQLPGAVDLAGLDGRRASATFRADRPWRGHLLFLRRDLVESYARDCRIMQVARGEREVAAGWPSVPSWMRAVHRSYAYVWRHIRIFGVDRRSAEDWVVSDGAWNRLGVQEAVQNHPPDNTDRAKIVDRFCR